jgi:hypothetical protein
MYNINQTSSFSTLQEFYIPAIHHTIVRGKKKMYNLSVPLGGQEIQIKRSSKNIKHASFANLILGAVRRMQRLFQPEKLKLEVIINRKPTPNDLSLEFELVNKNYFTIGKEEYFLSIVAQYSFKKPDTVTYFPILYRKWCSNGAVAVLSEQFKEVIPADRILEIGCEWTRCNFESYLNMANNFFESLRQNTDCDSSLVQNAEKLFQNVLGVKKRKNKRNEILLEYSATEIEFDIKSTLLNYVEQFGPNYLAVWNTMTDFASQEQNPEIRYLYFKSIGKYMLKEMKKVAKTQRDYWATTMNWQGLNDMIR